MRPFATRALLALTCLMLASPSAHAQGLAGVEGIFKQINDVNLSMGCWSVSSPVLVRTGDCPGGMRDYGVEVSFRLGEVGIGGGTKTDTTWRMQQRVTHGAGGRNDTAYTAMPVVTEKPTGWYALMELGLGYSQFSGFQSAVPGLDLRGTVRELPSLTLYTTLKHARRSWVGVYGGVRSGLVQLNDVQAFTGEPSDTATVYTGNGQVFQMGVVGGVVVEVKRVSFFAEIAGMNRDFESVRWSSGSSRVPPELPRRLNFSGRSVSLGMQVNIPK